MKLRPVSELAPQVENVLARVFSQLRALLPAAELHHIGATALPGAVTKGDIDVLIRVAEADFATAVDALNQHFAVKQPANWTAEFASFGDETTYELPLGVQLVVKDSRDDFLLFLRDYFISRPEALADYNRLKLEHAEQGAGEYWKAKNAFLTKILAARDDQTH